MTNAIMAGAFTASGVGAGALIVLLSLCGYNKCVYDQFSLHPDSAGKVQDEMKKEIEEKSNACHQYKEYYETMRRMVYLKYYIKGLEMEKNVGVKVSPEGKIKASVLFEHRKDKNLPSEAIGILKRVFGEGYKDLPDDFLDFSSEKSALRDIRK